MSVDAARRLDLEHLEVVFQNPCGYPEAGARRHRGWLEELARELAPEAGSLTVRFVSDREMRRLNREFRAKDQPTDVLSFPSDGFPDDGFPDPPREPLSEGERPPLGDIAVSIPTARRQAASHGHDVEKEIRVLLLHGVLHCLGYDHETDDGEMERFEAKLRRRWIA